MASIPGSGRSPGGNHGNPLQYSCLENPVDTGASELPSMGSQRVRHDWSKLALKLHLWRRFCFVNKFICTRFRASLPSLKNTLPSSKFPRAPSGLHVCFPQAPNMPHSLACLIAEMAVPSYRGKVLSTLCLINLILPTATLGGSCTIIFSLSILQMKKLRYREVKSCARDHTGKC